MHPFLAFLCVVLAGGLFWCGIGLVVFFRFGSLFWSMEVNDIEQLCGKQLFLPNRDWVGVVISDSARSNRLAGLSYNPMARALPSQEANWDLFVKTFVVFCLCGCSCRCSFSSDPLHAEQISRCTRDYVYIGCLL